LIDRSASEQNQRLWEQERRFGAFSWKYMGATETDTI
jgi:hypothetical protein